jgi:hypothetical protein
MNGVLVRAISIVVWVISALVLAMVVIAFSGHPAPLVVWLSELVGTVAGVGAPLLAMGILIVVAVLLAVLGAKIWGFAGRAPPEPMQHR